MKKKQQIKMKWAASVQKNKKGRCSAIEDISGRAMRSALWGGGAARFEMGE